MREAEGLSSAQFAGKIGEKTHRLQDIELRKQRAPGDVLAKIAEQFRINGTWLLTGSGSMRPPATLEPPEDFVLLPRYNVRAAAGAGAAVESEQIVDWLAFRREWVASRLRVQPKELALIEAHGDSMAPKIRAGDLLLVNLADRKLKTGNVYVVRSGDELQVKRVQVRADSSVVLLSDNPAYPPEEMAKKARPEVLGRVLWVGGEL
ncbi:MAG: helix-turn-helix transcriptional regulator [Candidatus Methylomirabilis sp.]|nr:helix-turn-helix transcriptional regulator [Deltaproteobacteria bacterium]